MLSPASALVPGPYRGDKDLWGKLNLSIKGARYPETGASAIETAESTKTAKKLRQERLARVIEGNPMATDWELVVTLGVSVSTEGSIGRPHRRDHGHSCASGELRYRYQTGKRNP